MSNQLSKDNVLISNGATTSIGSVPRDGVDTHCWTVWKMGYNRKRLVNHEIHKTKIVFCWVLD